MVAGGIGRRAGSRASPPQRIFQVGAHGRSQRAREHVAGVDELRPDHLSAVDDDGRAGWDVDLEEADVVALVLLGGDDLERGSELVWRDVDAYLLAELARTGLRPRLAP